MPKQREPDRSSPERLIEAGWATIDELPLERALGALGSANVAKRAGVTTGSFFHHFASVAEFTDSLVLSLQDTPDEQVGEVGKLLDALESRDIIELLHSDMVNRWQGSKADPGYRVRMRHEMLAWASHHRRLAEPTGDFETVGDVVSHRTRSRQHEVTKLFDLALHQAGRTLVEPFNMDRLVTAMTALYQGLAIRQAIDTDAVDDHLFADVATVLITGLTKPLGSERSLSDLAAEFGRAATYPAEPDSPQARSGARRRHETRDRIVDAATGMFAEGWEQVPASLVADRAGVASQTVANLFSGVRAVAACTFRVHLPAINAAASLAGQPDATVRAALGELADRAFHDPEPARALLSERIATIVHRGELLGDGDIRTEVPLAATLVGPLRRLRPHHDAFESAATLVHFTLCQAVTGAGTPDEIADTAMRLM